MRWANTVAAIPMRKSDGGPRHRHPAIDPQGIETFGHREGLEALASRLVARRGQNTERQLASGCHGN